MKFLSGVKYLFFPERGHRLILCLGAEDGASRFEVPGLNGTFNHLMAEQLRGADWDQARKKAFSHLGSIQPIQTIELDEDDLAHLTPYRVA